MGKNLLSDRFVGDLGRVVQQSKQQTEDQRAQQGWPGPDPQRPLPQGIIRFCLTEDLAIGGTAQATRIIADDDGDDEDADTVTINSPASLNLEMPSGSYGFAVMIAKLGWCVLTAPLVCYGQTVADWQEGGTRPADPYVSVLLCDDRKGANARGSPFNVYLPRTGDQDPQVYAAHTASSPYSAYPGDVILWQYDALGVPVAVGSYQGPKVGTVDVWSGSLATMPYGWCLCDGSNGSPNMQGLFVRCMEGTATLWTNGGTIGPASDGLGGYKRIGASSSRGSVQSGSGATVVQNLEDVESWAGTAHDGSTVNDAVVCPPCYVLAYKYRWC